MKMGSPMEHDLLVLSDIHLTDGRRPISGEEHLVPELERMLIAHLHHPEPGRHWRMVINGDFFDFLHVQLRPGEEVPFPLSEGERARGPGTSVEKSLWKLRKILAANGPILTALGRFLRAGHEVVLLPGNHDLELYWPEIREEIRASIRPHAGEEGLGRLIFKPWFYYEPGLVYVEHGSQFDADNSVYRWLAPEVPDKPGVLELSPGHIVNRYFTHRLGLGPFVGDTSQSALGYAYWMYKQFGFWRYFVLLGWYASFCWKVVRWAGRRTPATERAQALHAERRAEIEKEERMPPGGLAAIEAVAPPSVLSTRWRMLCRTMVPRVVTGVAAVTAAVLILIFGGLEASSFGLAAGVLIPPIAILTMRRHTYTGVADRHYPAAAEAARRALGVRHVIFGHQHVARAERPEEGDRRYVNLGCWVEGEGFERVPLHYFELRRGGAATGELKRWPAAPQSPVRAEPSIGERRSASQHG
jgi:UDP-2,3-diacylglucosamine pyrophosphatase LpxH